MSSEPASEHYRSPAPLKNRADFNARYGNVSWFGWLAGHLDPLDGNVLDIGCGPGWFWAKNADRLRPESLVLADLSEGMLVAARERLSSSHTIETVQLDAQSLPFPDNAFDAVAAMHMLYHVDHPELALQEMRRVLRPGGRAIITTVDDEDLAGLADLSRAIFGSSGTDLLIPVFGASRASDLIESEFGTATHHVLRDRYMIDDTSAALDYITSFPPGDGAGNHARAEFAKTFEEARIAAGGAFPADRIQHLFVARKAEQDQ